MEAAWLTACLPERFTILGQTLEPFSIGHVMALRRMGNVFVCENPTAPAVLGDIVQAVFICSQTFEQGQSELQQPDLADTLSKWGNNLGEFDFEDSCQWFRKYIAHALLLPEIDPNDKEGEKRMPGAPFLQRILLVLQGRLNYSRSEALNMPYAQALLDYFAFWEMEHAIKILSEKEIVERDELIAEHEQVWAEYVAAEEAKKKPKATRGRK